MISNDSPDDQDDAQDYFDYPSSVENGDSDETGSLYSAEETPSDERFSDLHEQKLQDIVSITSFQNSIENSSGSKIPVPSRFQDNMKQKPADDRSTLKEEKNPVEVVIGISQNTKQIWPLKAASDIVQSPSSSNPQATCLIAVSDPTEMLYFGADAMEPEFVLKDDAAEEKRQAAKENIKDVKALNEEHPKQSNECKPKEELKRVVSKKHESQDSINNLQFTPSDSSGSTLHDVTEKDSTTKALERVPEINQIKLSASSEIQMASAVNEFVEKITGIGQTSALQPTHSLIDCESRTTQQEQPWTIELSNDEDYDEIDDELPPPKKMTKLRKLACRFRRRNSSKESPRRISEQKSSRTMKVKRKTPAPSAEPSEVLNQFEDEPDEPILRKGTAQTHLKPLMNRELERSRIETKSVSSMKDQLPLEMTNVETSPGPSSKGSMTELETKSITVTKSSIMEIFKDSNQKGKDERSGRERKRVSDREQSNQSISSLNQNKLNSLNTRYRAQIKKYKNHLTDLNSYLMKADAMHLSLNQLKNQISDAGGGLPPNFVEIPKLPAFADDSMITKGRSNAFPSEWEVDKLKSVNSSLESKMQAVMKENRQLKDEMIFAKKKLDEANRFFAERQKANEEKNSTIDELKKSLLAAKRSADAYRKKSEDFQNMLQEQKVKYEEERSRRLDHEKSLAAQISNLSAKLSTEVAERERTEMMMGNAIKDKEAMEAQARAFQENIYGMQMKIHSMEQKIDSARQLEDECKQLEVSLQQMELELANSKKYADSLSSRIESNSVVEQELNKRIVELSEDVLKKTDAVEKLSEQNRLEQNRRMELYKMISHFSTLAGLSIDADELASAAQIGKTENSQLIVKIFTEFHRLIMSKDSEIEKFKQDVESLQNLHQEKKVLIEQLYEFVNEKNASICQKSPSIDIKFHNDDQEENKKDEMITEKNTSSILEELYRKQEAQRSSLLRMESQLRTLQGVHSHCGMRRTLQEARIGELETMLATFLD